MMDLFLLISALDDLSLDIAAVNISSCAPYTLQLSVVLTRVRCQRVVLLDASSLLSPLLLSFGGAQTFVVSLGSID